MHTLDIAALLLLPSQAGANMASHRRLNSALAFAAALLVLAAPIYAARELKQLGGFADGAVGAITRTVVLYGKRRQVPYDLQPQGGGARHAVQAAECGLHLL